MQIIDYYKILEISSNASLDDIKKSFKRLANKYHPDKNLGNNKYESKFIEILHAYEILSDPSKKQKYDFEFQKYYEAQNRSNQESKVSDEKEGITPEKILEIFVALADRREYFESSMDQKKELYEQMSRLLDDNVIDFLRTKSDQELIIGIIRKAMSACDALDYDDVAKICTRLAKLAGPDNGTIKIIFEYSKNRKRAGLRNAFVALLAIGGIMILLIKIIYSNNDSKENYDFTSYSTNNNLSQSDELNSKLNPLTKHDDDSVFGIKSKKIVDYSNWEIVNYKTGESPACYNYMPKYSTEVKNKLDISVGANTDVVIKLINFKTKRCIRYVYIRSGESYEIKNIPEAKYFLKIGYGRVWRQKNDSSKCTGRFTLNVLYKKGSEILDFNRTYTGYEYDKEGSYRTYNLPSYSLKLDVKSTFLDDKFKTDEISEDEFDDN